MIQRISIKNYKSVNDLSIELGRVNVFIGENGSGKSNILEALTLAATSINHSEIENDQLALRGVRTVDAKYYRSGFNEESIDKNIQFEIISLHNDKILIELSNDNQPFSKWKVSRTISGSISDYIKKAIEVKFSKDWDSKFTASGLSEFVDDLIFSIESRKGEFISKVIKPLDLKDFMIYAPENYFLRNYTTDETYIDPLGYRGEGLLKLIKVIKQEKPEQYAEIVKSLSLIDWLDKFDVVDGNSLSDSEFKLTDKYLEDGIASFDIRSANEGFLFLLFYLTLFITDYTPAFFAVDNIDTALNPKLCSKLISLLSKLATKYNKQVIFTTHSPSVLDGLNLNNEDERLYVVSRGIEGNTIATRVMKKEPLPGQESLKLSEQFLRGYIGGLPKNF